MMTNRSCLVALAAIVVGTLGVAAEQTRYAGAAMSYAWGWANPGYAAGAEDGKCSTTEFPNKEIVATDFRFSIPSGAVITGVRIEIKAGRACGGWLFVALSDGMTPIGVPKAGAMPSAPTCGATVFVPLGGAADLWGLTTLGAAQVNSSSFGVMVGSGYEVSLRMLDAVRVTVYYVVKYTVTVAASPVGSGMVTGGGAYDPGQLATLTATPAQGHFFVNWSEGSAVVSTSQTYSFTVAANRSLVANFSDRPCVAVRVDPVGGGTVGGAGCYSVGSTVVVTATPSAGYLFLNWTEGGRVVSGVATYRFTLSSSRDLVANFRQTPACLFHEDFEDITGWTRTGLWHIRDYRETRCFACAETVAKFAYYARSGACDYGMGTGTRGYLTSPLISISGHARIELRFGFFRHVEAYAGATRDRTYVQISLGGGKWRTVWTRDSRHASPECGTASVVFDTRGARTLRIRFVFDSANGLNNGFPGWAVDNLCVRAAGSDQRPSVLLLEEYDDLDPDVAEEGISVQNFPNPIRDVHTTTFSVLGGEVDRLRIEVFDLTGKLVWEGESGGSGIVWHTEDLTGLPLANGVYLYTVRVRVMGEWLAIGPQKLVILR